jgi:hypothetical protein
MSQEELFGGSEYLFRPDLKTVDQRLEAVADFVIERHKIYLRRAAGRPKPWTDDPILRNYRFTNIYRELDTVTLWIDRNIIQPYQDHPGLWFMLAIARLINWPDTLQRLMDEDVWPTKRFDPDAFYRVLSDIKSEKKKVITGAYIVNSVFPKGVEPEDRSKVFYIPYYGLKPLWDRRTELAPMFKAETGGSMEKAVLALTSCHGWGAFMAYQVIVDLSYSEKWLRRASDFNTFTSPGPGTTRGMNWTHTGVLRPSIHGRNLNPLMIQYRRAVNEILRDKVSEKFRTNDPFTGFAPLSMSNYSNTNCELSKYVRSLRDGGAAMRNNYPGSR